MKKAAITVSTYLAAIPAACVLAAATSFPFLQPVDFSVEFQMIITGFLSGFYVLTFTPFVVVGEVLMRKVRTHRVLPLVAVPMFGAVFPLLGFVLFPDRWWPDEPIDMKSSHLVVFICLALVSIGVGAIVALIRNRRPANTPGAQDSTIT